MKIIAVIPSRYGSTRFPGKSIALIAGKPMIERVYRQVEKSGCFEQIIVATDDQRIARVVKEFGGEVVFTASSIKSGTERAWEIIKGEQVDAVVNIQGDEPLIAEKLIADVHRTLSSGGNGIVTAAFWNTSYDEYVSPQVVKVVFNREDHALYFSRSPIPYVRREAFSGFYQHVGIYGYTRDALDLFFQSPESAIESSEKLEQLRFLADGKKIKILITPFCSHGVDVPEDIAKIEHLLRNQHE
jgi:3-deoxy-manno-octulosonate cytidylyltransferase (CMP-KDO synthetase)